MTTDHVNDQGDTPMTTVTADDDALHQPTSDDLFWTETAWFAFSVPERRVSGAIYPVFRTNQGVCSAGVYLWDDRGEGAHEILYCHNLWHLPLPDDIRSMSLPGGLAYEVVEPLRRYRVRYDDGCDLALDLDYTAIVAPHVPAEGGRAGQGRQVVGPRPDGERLSCWPVGRSPAAGGGRSLDRGGCRFAVDRRAGRSGPLTLRPA
jgi:hypothetical protein